MPPSPNDTASAISQLLQKINDVPQGDLKESAPAVLPYLKKLYDIDGPDFRALRQAVAGAALRRTLNPSVKCLVGNILSDHWDTFTLCGNLFLAGLRSPNPALRKLAQHKLMSFIQPAIIPALIQSLRFHESRDAACAILKAISGKAYPPDVHAWSVWWTKIGRTYDFIGQQLQSSRAGIAQVKIPAFDQARYWYAPASVRNVRDAETHPSKKEAEDLREWNAWSAAEVGHYLDAWTRAKPFLDRIVHQPDPRVDQFLEELLNDPGYGDYASLALAWRVKPSALPIIEQSYRRFPTPGRALARGSMGDKRALKDLWRMIESHPQPLAYALMDDTPDAYQTRLHAVGVLPAEQAFELLCHHVFNLDAAATIAEKKKDIRSANHWLDQNLRYLFLDRKRGYYVMPARAP